MRILGRAARQNLLSVGIAAAGLVSGLAWAQENNGTDQVPALSDAAAPSASSSLSPPPAPVAPVPTDSPVVLPSPTPFNTTLPPLPKHDEPAPGARHIFVIPGYLLSMTPAVASHSYSNGRGGTSYRDIATGHGLELSMAVYEPQSLWFYGGLMQAQKFYSFNGNHSRYAAGVQGGYSLWSLEVGVAHRTANDFRSDTTMLHLATVTSLVFFNIVLQLGLPVMRASYARPGYAVEGSFGLAVKLPVLVQ